MQLKGLLELAWSVGRSDGRSVSWLTFVCQTHSTDFKSSTQNLLQMTPMTSGIILLEALVVEELCSFFQIYCISFYRKFAPQAPFTVFKSYKYRLLHIIPMNSRCA